MGEQVGDRRRKPADVDRVGLQRLAAGEGEQPLDQLGALLGGAAGHADDLPVLLLERQPPLDQAEAAEHRGEQIVEIVGDAAGQLADRVHLARFEQLLLQILAVGDVEQGAGILGGVAVRRAQQHRLVEEMLVAGRRRTASDIRSPSRRCAAGRGSRRGRARGPRDGAGRPTGSAGPRPRRRRSR